MNQKVGHGIVGTERTTDDDHSKMGCGIIVYFILEDDTAEGRLSLTSRETVVVECKPHVVLSSVVDSSMPLTVRVNSGIPPSHRQKGRSK